MKKMMWTLMFLIAAGTAHAQEGTARQTEQTGSQMTTNEALLAQSNVLQVQILQKLTELVELEKAKAAKAPSSGS